MVVLAPFPWATVLPKGVRLACEMRGRDDGTVYESWFVWEGRRHISGFSYSSREVAEQRALRAAGIARALAHVEVVVGELGVYTREQYERACSAVNIRPAPDSELGNFEDLYGEFTSGLYTAKDEVMHMLRRLRLCGIQRDGVEKGEQC
ncbi:hypothetical protein [Streptomyces sp. CBMA29]|uniref:hypothetical protein n=1 Tax=Streptomyces sp. CBMA29 TaxID=1896314 RepID=UPI001662131C|nr:hypothetical protein [Streptomyces sp. CBMA29]MBD0734117.1 hypothetical protein [Streptomyces sp. CBMA29]